MLADLLAARLAPGEALDLITLDSGAVLAIDHGARWLLRRDVRDKGLAFDGASAHAFGELVERSRDDFEGALAEAARACDLPAEEVVAAFPAEGLVRGVLAKNFAYLTRLALVWARPSELRALRPDILRVAEAREMPGPVRDLAKRLTVPEGYD